MIKKFKYVLVLCLIILIGLATKSLAGVTASNVTVSSGKTVTVTIGSQEPVASGIINVTLEGGLKIINVTVEDGLKTINGNKISFARTTNATGIMTITLQAPEVTKNETYNVTFTPADFADEKGPVSSSAKTITVTVTADEQKPNQDPQTDPEEKPEEKPQENPETPEEKPQEKPEPVVEPNFTSTNIKMYSTETLNLRATWSTTSAAVTVPAGTELTVIGTSTNTVNGYVWYKVSYNGQTRYAVKKYLTTTKPEEPETPEEKSNNNNLKSLVTNPTGLTPEFSKDTKEYSLTIGFDINDVEVTALVEDEKASVEVTGNKDLKVGDNTITITVTAEDGSKAVYKINVTKTEEEQLKLSSLKISDFELSPKFDPDTYEYSVSVRDIASLNISAEPNNKDATVEIIGNENFEEGDNLVTIILKTEDGENTVTYQINVKRQSVIEQNTESNKFYVLLLTILGIAALAVFISIIYILIGKRKNDDEDAEDTEYYDELYDENDDENNYNDYDYEDDNGDYDESEEEDDGLEEDDDNPKSNRGKHSR